MADLFASEGGAGPAVKTYELTTLADVYESVPVDKIMLCMREIAEGMVLAKQMAQLVMSGAEALAPGPSVSLFWPGSCQWVDDGKEDKAISIIDDASGETALTLEVTKAPITHKEPTSHEIP